MKSRLAIIVVISGWFFPLALLALEYAEYGPLWPYHFLRPLTIWRFFSYAVILAMPIGSMITGYLINERKQLLNKVKASEKKYRDLYDNAPDGYHSLDSEGLILEVNGTWLKMFGYQRQEVERNMRITEILSPEGIEKFKKRYPLFKNEGIANNIEYAFRRKDGTFLPALINATAVYDDDEQFVMSRAIVRDNRAAKEYERKLRNASEEWREAFDAMPYGVLLLDGDFTIIKTNKYVADFTGMSVKELVSKKCYDIIHSQDRPLEICPLSKVKSTKKTEMVEYHDEESNRYFRIITTPIIYEDKKINAYIHSLIDITELKQNEKRLSESRIAFLNMLRDTNAAYEDLRAFYYAFIRAFANAIDAKSPWTKGHSERVTNYSLAIAEALGLNQPDIDTLRTAALLHDVGKIGTFDHILDKPGGLTDEEFALVRMHPAQGEKILSPVKELADMPAEARTDHSGMRFNASRQLVRILPIIRAHHERIDGRGYPDGLGEDEIPLLAKIICVADSFDSMTADRPYRKAPGKAYAMSELKRCSGTQFAPEVVEAFLTVLGNDKDDLILATNGT